MKKLNRFKYTKIPKVLGILLVLFFFTGHSFLFALDIPSLKNRVNDYAGMISSSTRNRLEAQIKALEESDSTQVVILTIPSLEGEALEDYTIRVAQTIGIGQKKDDNGVLFFVSKNDHKIRIEVGYGLEGRLTDLLAGRIIDYEISPDFKAGRFDEGFLKGTNAITSAVKGEYKATEGTLKKEGSRGFEDIIMPFFILFIIISMLGKTKRSLGGLAGAVIFPLLASMYLPFGFLLILALIPLGFGLGLLLSILPLFSLAYYGGGGFFGGGSGGGFSGGGGGFGGGGASGGW
ncbi:MAG: TPM domain-containing protein [bacterium]